MALPTPVKHLEILKSAKHTDFTIVCSDGTEFKVHRELANAASLRIANQDVMQDKITISKSNQDTVARTILFMYGLADVFYDYPRGSSTATGANQLPASELTDAYFEGFKIQIQVYAAATVLQMKKLKELVALRFASEATSVLQYEDFAEPLRMVYERTQVGDKDLRFRVTQFCLARSHYLPKKLLDLVKRHEPWVSSSKLVHAIVYSGAGPVRDPTTKGFIHGVVSTVDKVDLENKLEEFGDVRQFSVSRGRESAYVEYYTIDALAAAVAANPLVVGNTIVFIEPRRPPPQVHGATNGLSHRVYYQK